MDNNRVLRKEMSGIYKSFGKSIPQKKQNSKDKKRIVHKKIELKLNKSESMNYLRISNSSIKNCQSNELKNIDDNEIDHPLPLLSDDDEKEEEEQDNLKQKFLEFKIKNKKLNKIQIIKNKFLKKNDKQIILNAMISEEKKSKRPNQTQINLNSSQKGNFLEKRNNNLLMYNTNDNIIFNGTDEKNTKTSPIEQKLSKSGKFILGNNNNGHDKPQIRNSNNIAKINDYNTKINKKNKIPRPIKNINEIKKIRNNITINQNSTYVSNKYSDELIHLSTIPVNKKVQNSIYVNNNFKEHTKRHNNSKNNIILFDKNNIINMDNDIIQYNQCRHNTNINSPKIKKSQSYSNIQKSNSKTNGFTDGFKHNNHDKNVNILYNLERSPPFKMNICNKFFEKNFHNSEKVEKKLNVNKFTNYSKNNVDIKDIKRNIAQNMKIVYTKNTPKASNNNFIINVDNCFHKNNFSNNKQKNDHSMNKPKLRKNTYEKGGKFNNIQTTFVVFSNSKHNSSNTNKMNHNFTTRNPNIPSFCLTQCTLNPNNCVKHCKKKIQKSKKIPTSFGEKKCDNQTHYHINMNYNNINIINSNNKDERYINQIYDFSRKNNKQYLNIGKGFTAFMRTDNYENYDFNCMK